MGKAPHYVTNQDAIEKPYILMHNYASEGWSIHDRYATSAEAVQASMDTASYGAPCMIVKQMFIKASLHESG